ncbi:hypothetical protein OnM2_023009 [Erysiphe neolycopersici]|uniref:Uncharacterized protein n=1 Tax=Erysiphe neolycopersici TaxID=212602 RepID=A0A420I296_9PEZI|nr:hypothetical protein OnM2_023009 [Erysiphe neolycopersici]
MTIKSPCLVGPKDSHPIFLAPMDMNPGKLEASTERSCERVPSLPVLFGSHIRSHQSAGIRNVPVGKKEMRRFGEYKQADERFYFIDLGTAEK